MPTTYENVSVLNARLFPGDFGMAGFPGFPDAFRTNRTLLQMRPKYRAFATSDPRKGVHLTEKGKSEVSRVLSAIGVPTTEGKPVPSSVPVIDARRPNRDKERTFNPAQVVEEGKSKLLFRKYKEGKLEEADTVHLLGLLKAYDHTPPGEVRKMYRSMREAANDAQDDEFLGFLTAVHVRFRDYLEKQDPSKVKE